MNRISILFLVLSLPLITLSQTIDGTIEIDSTPRTFHLFIPEHLQASRSYPLIIMLHGGEGTGSQMSRFTGFNEWAQKDSFIVCCPDGWRRQWNDRRIGSGLPFEKDDVKFISILIDYLVVQHRADSDLVFVAGISNGAMMSLLLTQEISEKLRGIAIVCGSIPENYFSSYYITVPVSVLIMNGTDDPLVKYEGGSIGRKGNDRGVVVSTPSMLDKMKALLGCNGEPISSSFEDKNKKDGCSAVKFDWKCNNNCELTLIKVEGGGHTWPGGFQYLPKSIVGKVCRDFNATEVICEFFKSQPAVN